MSELSMTQILPLIQMAYAEDLGDAGDVTTWATIPEEAQSVAVLNSRNTGVISGVDIALACFNHIDPELELVAHKTDGSRVVSGDALSLIHI